MGAKKGASFKHNQVLRMKRLSLIYFHIQFLHFGHNKRRQRLLSDCHRLLLLTHFK